MFKPPFEIYRNSDIADQNGHICTADNKEFAVLILDALRDRFGSGLEPPTVYEEVFIPDQPKSEDAGLA